MTLKERGQSFDSSTEKKVRESFLRQGFMQHLGASLVSIAPGFGEISRPFRAEMSQQHGYFHAGVSAAIADSACGYAAYTLTPHENSVLTVEFKLSLLAPALGETLRAKARVIRPGRTLSVCAADVFVKQGGIEKLCATSLATIMNVVGHNELDSR
jgi:uncharacterized protein (TIGR00369 family)